MVNVRRRERQGTGTAMRSSYNIMNARLLMRFACPLHRAHDTGVRVVRAAGRVASRGSIASADTQAGRAVTTRAARPRIVFLGDSLTAGYGLAKEESVPSLIQARLHADGYPYEVVNAGVSGDTSAGGLSRLDWSLEGDVRMLVIELGANDGLRGLPVAAMKRNLTEIITRARIARDHGGADRHGGAAEFRRGLHRRVPAGVSRSREGARRHVHARSISTGSRAFPA